MPELESKLTGRIVRALRDRGAWAVKIHGGPHQSRGLPDVMAVYRGHGIGLEVKRPGKESTLTAIQAATLDDITAAGGAAVMVTSVDAATRVLDVIDGLYR